MASSSSPSPRQEDPQETAASNGNHHSSPVPRSPSPNVKRSSKSPVKDLEERDERSNRSKSPASRSRSRSPSRSPARKRSISPVRRRSRSHSPRRRRSYSPRRRRSYSPRRRSRSRSPRRSSRYRSRSKSPYNRRRHSSRDRYSRRSPPRHRGRRSPRRRPWTPPADRTNGLGEPGNNLFVAGFNFITTERDLERKFGKFGKVYDCRIVRDKRSGESRGFGFLTLEHDEEADAAIKALDQTEWNGRIVLVEKAKTPTRY